ASHEHDLDRAFRRTSSAASWTHVGGPRLRPRPWPFRRTSSAASLKPGWLRRHHKGEESFRRTSSAASLKLPARLIESSPARHFPPNFIGGLIEAARCRRSSRSLTAPFRRT